jgi:hypothetical protein
VGEKKMQAKVKKVVAIKGSLYLNIPKSVATRCEISAGDQVALVVNGKSRLTFFLREDG